MPEKMSTCRLRSASVVMGMESGEFCKKRVQYGVVEIPIMPKTEKAIHQKAFAIYTEMGGMSPAFFAQFRTKFGKSRRTAYDWEKAFGWKERAKEPADEAVAELKEEGKLNAKELVSGFLDLCQTRMDGMGAEKSYVGAMFATAFDRIPSEENPEPENPLEIKTLEDMDRLVRMGATISREEREWVKLGLVLAGEPDSRNETTHNLAQAIMDGNYFKES